MIFVITVSVVSIYICLCIISFGIRDIHKVLSDIENKITRNEIRQIKETNEELAKGSK